MNTEMTTTVLILLICYDDYATAVCRKNEMTTRLCEGISCIYRHCQVRAQRGGRSAAGRRRRGGNTGQQERRPVAVSDVGPPRQTRVGSAELPGCQVR